MKRANETILVVEDDPNSATLLIDLLTAHGYRVINEGTGLAATKRLSEERVDLILLDLRLPEQNGFMVAETLKRNPATARIPIIVVSAHNDRQNRLRAYRSGVNMVLSKPIDLAELVPIVANLLAVTRPVPVTE
ncbi:MAG TPA: response regulator [Symbiobacteriaceae bacterium]|nr:response regulator [Symbiobacteriaceae bacterium]